MGGYSFESFSFGRGFFSCCFLFGVMLGMRGGVIPVFGTDWEDTFSSKWVGIVGVGVWIRLEESSRLQDNEEGTGE